MKRTFTLSIPRPCAEKWESFAPTHNGGFCSTCSKTVIDFSQMTDDEILSFLANKPQHACGRFNINQLKTYSHPQRGVTVNPGITLLKAGFISLLLAVLSKPTLAQYASPRTTTEVVQYPVTQAYKSDDIAGFIVRGVVKDELDQPMPGVSIVLKGSTVETWTDAQGHFEFPRKLQDGNVLLFRFIGYTPKEYVVKKSSDQDMNITMQMDTFELMGEVQVNGVYDENHSLISRLWNKVKNLF